MNPAIVLVIRNEGISTVRLIASGPKEEREAMDLYRKIQGPINKIRKILRGDDGNTQNRGRNIDPTKRGGKDPWILR